MASLVTHLIVGASIALPASRLRIARESLRPGGLALTAAAMAALPDADTAFWGLIDYGDFMGHRGFWHSPFFLVFLSFVLAGLMSALVRRMTLPAVLLIGGVWSMAGISHSLLDALTNGGLGVMMFYPWSEARFFFPWRPIEVSPIGLARAIDGFAYVFPSELPFCIAAIAVGTIGYRLIGRNRS